MPFLNATPTVSNGTKVAFANVASGFSTPTPYTISVEAAATAGATSISISSNVAVELQHDAVLYFTGGKRAVINTATTDLISVGTTATTVPVRPLAASLATTDEAITYELRRLLGVRDCSVPIAPQPEDTFTMDDGFGVSNQIVGVERTVNLSGLRKSGCRAMYEILVPYHVDDVAIRGLLWTDLLFPNGDHFSGLVRVTGGNGFSNGAVRTSMNYQMTLTFQGDTGFFYDNTVEAALLTA
jgi:hypothetical protein